MAIDAETMCATRCESFVVNCVNTNITFEVETSQETAHGVGGGAAAAAAGHGGKKHHSIIQLSRSGPKIEKTFGSETFLIPNTMNKHFGHSALKLLYEHHVGALAS